MFDEQQITDTAFDGFAQTATYHAPDSLEVVDVDVIVDFDVEVIDYGTQTIDDHDFVSFKRSQIDPEPGAKLTGIDGFEGQEFTIGRREKDDRFVVRHYLLEYDQ